MNLSLNKLRIILLSLMGIGLGTLSAVAPVGFPLLAGIVIIGFVWLVAETSTHASYTMMIGKLLERIFKPQTAPKVDPKGTRGGSDDTTKEESGQPLTNGNVVGEIKPATEQEKELSNDHIDPN